MAAPPISRMLARSASMLRDFLSGEAAGGLVLIAAAALAIALANSPLAEAYHHLLEAPLGPAPTAKLGPWTLHLLINDALMALFFLVVGLEIKRELVDGRLATWADRRLPVIAATAGMVVPALVFLAVTGGGRFAAGWAIPAATDIAFAMAVLALLGSRAPTSLKLFLVTVAIVDDMGAVAIIALVYTAGIAPFWLAAAAVLWVLMWALNRRGVSHLAPYLLLAALLWWAVLQSGVHATVAGVLAAMTIPVVCTPGAPEAQHSPLHRLEHALHPWSAFAIVPLFGFANAGLSLSGLGLDQLLAPVPLGVALGLLVGKQVGIFGAVRLAVALRIACRPARATWLQLYGVALLCGIGFTMSLFITDLAFAGRSAEAALMREEARLGVLVGSLLSAIAGYLVLRLAPIRR